MRKHHELVREQRAPAVATQAERSKAHRQVIRTSPILPTDAIDRVGLATFFDASAPSRIRRSSTTTMAVATSSGSKTAKRENWAGQTDHDNPLKPEPDVVELDDDLEDEADETEAETETESASLSEAESASVDLSGVTAVVRTGSQSTSKTKRREIKPTVAAPTVNNNGAGSDCTPADFTSGDLTWSVVDKGKKGWGVKVTALRTTGHINVKPTPNLPTTKTAPNTPNPVDGGNIENSEGSPADWRAVLKSMRNYHTKGGGRGPWHDTAASTAHEWAHWDTDWMKNCLGTTWPTYRKKMERLKVSKATCSTVGAARTALTPLVEAKLSALDSKATKKWNKIPDEPGDWFANGYKAGQEILDRHIKKVDKYADKKGWTLLGKVINALTGEGGGGPGGGAVATAPTG